VVTAFTPRPFHFRDWESPLTEIAVAKDAAALRAALGSVGPLRLHNPDGLHPQGRLLGHAPAQGAALLFLAQIGQN